MENSKRLTAKRCNGIKDGYWSMAHKDELVQRLGEYEDICADPDELRRAMAAYEEKLERDAENIDGLLEVIHAAAEGKDHPFLKLGLQRCTRCGEVFATTRTEVPFLCCDCICSEELNAHGKAEEDAEPDMI